MYGILEQAAQVHVRKPVRVLLPALLPVLLQVLLRQLPAQWWPRSRLVAARLTGPLVLHLAGLLVFSSPQASAPRRQQELWWSMQAPSLL